MPFFRALDLVLDSINAGRDKLTSAYWYMEEGVITLSSGADLDQEMRVRVYDVADLLMAVPNFQGPRLGIPSASGGGGGGAGSTGQSNSSNSSGSGGLSGLQGGGTSGTGAAGTNESDSTALKAKQQDDLLNIVKSTTSADLWEPTGKGSIRFVGGRMIVSQSRLGFKLMDKALSR